MMTETCRYDAVPMVKSVTKDHEVDGISIVELKRQAPRGFYSIILVLCCLLLSFLSLRYWFLDNHGGRNTGPTTPSPVNTNANVSVPHVRMDLPSFPSYLSYGGENIRVDYDERAIRLNGDRVLFLGGSMHPVRATHDTWRHALNEAVHNGLNMVTLYTFWSEHQPIQGSPPNFSFASSARVLAHAVPPFSQQHPNNNNSNVEWELADAIREAGLRGLFVHIRIGPYVCAEYNYGGIPEWVPLSDSNMRMRRMNQPWMDAMSLWVESLVGYLTDQTLWAHQGGPIVMAQMENEVGGEPEEIPALQEYVDWSGWLAEKVAPKVLWTMCNGLTAPNAINTCNGYGSVSCSVDWLEQYGQSGKIQKTQPPMWTEDEGGFQIWGSSPEHPSDYFWGQKSVDMARDSLNWFARGGSHLNYYMFFGGYNRGGMAAAGITNAYAMDAPLYPSGERHYPKFLQTQALHLALAEIAHDILEQPSALHHQQALHIWSSSNNNWEVGDKQRSFIYSGNASDSQSVVAFLENDADRVVTARIPGTDTGAIVAVEMSPHSAILVKDQRVIFDSASILKEDTAFSRRYQIVAAHSDLVWETWPERIGTVDNIDTSKIYIGESPVEQNDLMVRSKRVTAFAWFHVEFETQTQLKDATLRMNTTQGVAFSVYLDGAYSGTANNHNHGEMDIFLNVSLGLLTDGSHAISILSESFGNPNLIGRWGASTTAKRKGLTGHVNITGINISTGNVEELALVDGSNGWKSQSGLNDETMVESPKQIINDEVIPQLTWSRTQFEAPQLPLENQTLMLDITWGRGHAYLNGKDLGMWWNITREPTSERYTQRYYQLPPDWLVYDKPNDLVLFPTMEIKPSSIAITLTWLEGSAEGHFSDEVDYLDACQ